MKEKKPGKYIESFVIPPSKTHNTIPPYNQSIIQGPECKLFAVRIVGNSISPCIYVGGGTHGDEINGIAHGCNDFLRSGAGRLAGYIGTGTGDWDTRRLYQLIGNRMT